MPRNRASGWRAATSTCLERERPDTAGVTDIAADYVRHLDHLQTFVFALLRDPVATEDVMQEVGLTILKEHARRAAVADFLPWARTICRRRVADHLRRRYRQRRFAPLPEDLADQIETAFVEADDALVEHEQLLGRLRDCLAKLGDRARSMLEARYATDLDAAGIAARFGWTVAAVKVGLSKTRRKLAECLQRGSS